jgi:hypothetical protein
MTRPLNVWAFTLGSVAVLATAAQADVVIRGPFGGQIVVTSPDDVRVGPGGVVVVPAPVMPTPTPVVRPQADPLPPPKVAMPAIQPAPITPVSPQDFVKTFQPVPGIYDVLFVHPRTNQPVKVAFELPPGNPRVSYFAHSLVFDYGRHEVEIRFQLGGKVKVVQR